MSLKHTNTWQNFFQIHQELNSMVYRQWNTFHSENKQFALFIKENECTLCKTLFSKFNFLMATNADESWEILIKR